MSKSYYEILTSFENVYKTMCKWGHVGAVDTEPKCVLSNAIRTYIERGEEPPRFYAHGWKLYTDYNGAETAAREINEALETAIKELDESSYKTGRNVAEWLEIQEYGRYGFLLPKTPSGAS
jgi:hypothetical protein